MRQGRKQGFLSRMWLDALFIAQVVLTVLVLTIVTAYTVTTANRVASLNQQQVEFAIRQNEQALCNQHNMLLTLKKVGDRLGLQTDDIVVPSTEGLSCESSSVHSSP